MGYKDFTKIELAEILGIIQAALACKSEQDVITVTGKIMNLVSADMGVCALGEIDSGRLLKVANHNWPAEWAMMYTAEELYKRDPVFLFNYDHYKSFEWKDATDRFSERPNRDIMNRASEFRIKYGISSGICGGGSKGSIFSFASDRNRFSSHHLKILDILTPHIHQALVKTLDTQTKSDICLSNREKEVLCWMREGKTNWEISMILNISERTVKFHVQNIERKLNAVNKAHAIAIAMDCGLVL